MDSTTTTTTTTPTITSETRAIDSGRGVVQRLDKNQQQQQLQQQRKPRVAASHQCPDCDAKFAYRQYLSRHKKDAHNRIANAHRAPCEVCGARVGRGDAFKRHMAAAHPKAALSTVKDEWNAPPLTTDLELDNLLERYWQSIVTKHRLRPVVDIVNIRVWRGGLIGNVQHDDVWEKLLQAWNAVPVQAKVNCSVGCVLRNITTGELRYFHSSENNASLLERPRLVTSVEDLRQLWEDISDIDLEERARQRRPTTSWRLLMVTNLTFYVFKLNGVARVGAPPAKGLPSFLLNNKSLIAMDKYRGKTYTDSLCFFRCLAISLACQCPATSPCRCKAQDVSVTRTKELYNQYRLKVELSDDAKTFSGVGFEDLMPLEELFGLRITVLEKQANGDCIVHWNTQRTTGHKLVLNIYQDHFRWVKIVNSFTNAFVCQVCSRRYQRQNDLN